MQTPHLTSEPNSLGCNCSVSANSRSACVVVANSTKESVRVVRSNDPTASSFFLIVPPETTACTIIPHEENIDVVGNTTEQRYYARYPIDGARRELFVHADLNLMRAKPGGFPFVALMVVSGAAFIALIVLMVVTNGRVSRLCAPKHIAEMTAAAAAGAAGALHASSPADEQSSRVSDAAPLGDTNGSEPGPPCTYDEGRKHRVGWGFLVFPFLMFAGALIGYLYVEGPLSKRANARQCAKRGGKWFPGYSADGTFWQKLLCRGFGVCDCLNAEAQLACAKTGFVYSRMPVAKTAVVTPQNVILAREDLDTLETMTQLHTKANDIVRERLARTPVMSIDTPEEVALTRQLYEQKSGGRNNNTDIGHGKSLSAPAPMALLVWNQRKANALSPKEYDYACCPNDENSPFKECFRCDSANCVPASSQPVRSAAVDANGRQPLRGGHRRARAVGDDGNARDDGTDTQGTTLPSVRVSSMNDNITTPDPMWTAERRIDTTTTTKQPQTHASEMFKLHSCTTPSA